MLITLISCAVASIRQRWKPDAQQDTRWDVRNHLIAIAILTLIVGVLVIISIVLELHRETDPHARISKRATGLPLLVAVVLVALGVIEMCTCNFPTIMKLVEQYRPAASGGVGAAEIAATVVADTYTYSTTIESDDGFGGSGTEMTLRRAIGQL